MKKSSGKKKRDTTVPSVVAALLLVFAVALKNFLAALERDEVNEVCELKTGTRASKIIPTLRTFGFSEMSSQSGGSGIQVFDSNEKYVGDWGADSLDGLRKGFVMATKVSQATFERRYCRILFSDGYVTEAKFYKTEIKVPR